MKKIITIILTVFAFCVPRKAYASTSYDIRFTISDNRAIVTGFSGKPEYIEIPENIDGCPVSEIRDNAFYNCKSLKEIILPDSLEKIGHHSFYACTSLERIDIPDSVSEIGMGCFCGCTSLTSAEISDNLKTLSDSCFRACTSLTEIEFPEHTETIEKFCFSGCISLEYVSLGSNISSIGNRAFYMCSSLKNIYISDSVKNIGFQSFGYQPDINGAYTSINFTIIGSKNSEAEKYAKENSVSFTESVPTFQQLSAVSGKPETSYKHFTAFLAVTVTISFLLITAVRQFIYDKNK